MQLPYYNKIDLNIYRIFPLKKGNFVVYTTFSNILDTQNISKEVYNDIYEPSYRYYSGRIVYFGTTFSFF